MLIALASEPRRVYNPGCTVALTRQVQGREPMSPGDPITCWIDRLKAGDRAAVEPLWERFFRRMVLLARRRLRAAPRRAADEEDVALSAFDSFCRGAEEGRLPRLTDRDSLWSHLIVYTMRKAGRLIRRETAAKRDYRRARDEASLSGEPGLLEFLSQGLTPELAALAAEQYRLLLGRLPDGPLRSVAQWKMEGDTNDEIALKLGCVRRSVERMLQLTRSLWAEGGGP